ncbi:n-acetylmuramoyl-L-alanine amidase [Ruminococcus sp. CAG:254]|nr:n-acetylmuramoyl-L-alanine amidase [Ruminococcus sp. CAG:254]
MAKLVRVHYYVDNVCAWQNLPHSLSGWHAADGSGNGNRRTIAIECIMSSAYNSTNKKSEDNCAKLAAALLKQYGLDINHLYTHLPPTLSGWHAADGSGNGNRKTIAIECIMSGTYNSTDKKSEDNCARLAAALLKQYGLGISHLYTHTHWLNVRDGKSGTVDQLNTMYNRYKMCPAYILPHWAEFKKKVQSYLNAGTSTISAPSTKQIYRVRKSWADAKSQLGAY